MKEVAFKNAAVEENSRPSRLKKFCICVHQVFRKNSLGVLNHDACPSFFLNICCSDRQRCLQLNNILRQQCGQVGGSESKLRIRLKLDRTVSDPNNIQSSDFLDGFMQMASDYSFGPRRRSSTRRTVFYNNKTNFFVAG